MRNLLDLATALGLKDKVIWLNNFVPTEELMLMFKCTSVYVTTFDESTPTSVCTLPLTSFMLFPKAYATNGSFPFFSINLLHGNA